MKLLPPRRITTLTVIAALGLLGTACGGGDDAPPAAAGHVNVVDNKFEPGTIEILPGDTVTWDFKGGVQHNVVGDGFKSDNMKDGSFEHTFNSADSYDYVCTLHPGMKGTVEVG